MTRTAERDPLYPVLRLFRNWSSYNIKEYILLQSPVHLLETNSRVHLSSTSTASKQISSKPCKSQTSNSTNLPISNTSIRMEWTKKQYNSYYESYMPWIEDKYLAWFGENKTSYVAKGTLRTHATSYVKAISWMPSRRSTFVDY